MPISSGMNKRYERKFLLPYHNESSLETIIKLHPSIFKEIYYKRKVNNIYYDTHNFKFFQENVDGNTNRMKIRLRWYEDLLHVTDPKFEFKIKNGLLGHKKIFLANSFSLNENIPNIDKLKSNLTDLYTNKLKAVSPVMLNSYDRKYFQSEDGLFRLTIDTNLSFYKISNHEVDWKLKTAIPECVLELKYDAPYDDIAEKIVSFFPFRLSKSSKYVMGISKLYSI